MDSLWRQNRTRASVLLATMLLLAQLGLTLHQYDHAADVYDEACLTCVASNAFEDLAVAELPAILDHAEFSPTIPAIRRVEVESPDHWRPPGRAPPLSIPS